MWQHSRYQQRSPEPTPEEQNMIGLRYRHPLNRFGQGSPEFYQEEYRLYGLSRERYYELWEAQAPRCPHCGTPAGLAFGTGDCGCEVDPY